MNMREISLNEQDQDFLKVHFNVELDSDEYSETSKGIMRHILSKLEDKPEDFGDNEGTIVNELTEKN